MKDQKISIKTALWISSFISLINLFVVFKSIDSGVTWKIVASSIGFLGFFGMTIMVLLQLRKENLK